MTGYPCSRKDRGCAVGGTTARQQRSAKESEMRGRFFVVQHDGTFGDQHERGERGRGEIAPDKIVEKGRYGRSSTWVPSCCFFLHFSQDIASSFPPF